MRINIRVSQKGVDAVDEQIAHGVFHVLRFVVHLIPCHFEGAQEKQLDQPMPPNHPQGEHAAGPR